MRRDFVRSLLVLGIVLPLLAACSSPLGGDLTTPTPVATFAPPQTPLAAGAPPCLVAVVSRGRVLTSSDSVTWREVASVGAPGGVARGESLWVAAGNGKLSISADGSTWQTKDTEASLEAVATDGHRWVAVGLAGAILTSGDGLSWTSAVADRSWDLRAVGYGGGRWIAVGETSGTEGRGVIVSSDDGTTWTQAYRFDEPRDSGGSLPTFSSLAWNGARWMTVAAHTVKMGDAVDWQTVGLILTSTDGTSWTATDGLDWFASAVAAHDGIFLAAFGYGGNHTSSDGVDWTHVSDFNLPFGGPPGLVWAGREWIGYGESAIAYRSADAASWRTLPLYPGESGYATLGYVGGIGGSCPASS